ncbi:MAG: TspO/MBR family protein [Candidatus Pacearchaeota archaeon]
MVFAVAFIGSQFSSPNTSTKWYDSIKPEITPPSRVFPVVWNVLFLQIAISLYLIWTNNESRAKDIAIIYGSNFALNILWSAIFFGLKSLQVAFFELILLWISIGIMVFYSHQFNKNASYLLIPYFLWVAFAGVINYLAAFG